MTIRLNKKAKKNIFVALMLLIPVVHFIIFWVIVNFNSILYAFQRQDPLTGNVLFTWGNFAAVKKLFELGTMKTALVNTLITCGFQTIFLLPWAFFLTYFLYKKIRLSGLWRTLLFVPTVLPAVAMTSIFSYLVHPEAPFGIILKTLFGESTNFMYNEKYSRWMIILYFFWTNFGGQFILISGAMSRVPKEVIESAYLDGAGMRVEMFRILLPLCWPTLSMLLLLSVSTMFSASGPVLLLTDGQANTQTISFWIFKEVWRSTPYLPATVGLICTLILFPIVLAVRWALSKVYADVEF